MLLYKQKKGQSKGNRLLLTVTVLGSAGPFRFVVNECDSVALVIDTTLKAYAKEGRLPILGTDVNGFFLYYPGSFSVPNRLEAIGSLGSRNFMLCKYTNRALGSEIRNSTEAATHKAIRNWKRWINKSLNLKVPSQ